MFSDWSTERAIHEGYKASHWVYSCVRLISRAVASLEWVAVEGSGVDAQDLPDHPLTRLLAKPNPYISGSDLFERVVAHLHLGGNAMVTKIGSGAGRRRPGDIEELWPIMPDRARPVPAEKGHVSHYELLGSDGARKPDMRPEDVCHVMFVDPGNDYWGMSPLQAAAKLVDMDVEAIRFNKVSLQNRAVADGALSTDQQLNEEQFERLNAQVRDNHAGPSNARRTLLLEAGLSWQQMSLSPAEMDFIASRRMTREDILAVFGVPPAMLGLVVSATQSDVGQMRTQFWTDTVVAQARHLQSALTLSLASEYGDGISVRPMLENVEELKVSWDEKILSASRLFLMGVPLNEINRLLELGLDEGMLSETGYLPANLIPASAGGRDPLDDLAELGLDGSRNADGS